MSNIEGRKTHDFVAARMNRPLVFGLIVGLLVSSGVLGSAQDSTATGAPQTSISSGKITAPHQLVLTGCLRRDSSGTFSLTSENGKTFDLIPGSDSVDLSKHVFHAVRITGKESPNAVPPAGNDDSQKSPSLPVMRVLTLEVLSNSCTR